MHQLGTITSSRRFKTDVRDMGRVSEKLLRLRPVTFRYKQADAKGKRAVQYGLIAEEVAKVFPELVQYDKAGKPFTVYYHLLTPLLLDQLQKQQSVHKAQVTAQNKRMAAQQNAITSLKAELASLRQAQAEQNRLLARLAAGVQTADRAQSDAGKVVSAKH